MMLPLNLNPKSEIKSDNGPTEAPTKTVDFCVIVVMMKRDRSLSTTWKHLLCFSDLETLEIIAESQSTLWVNQTSYKRPTCPC